MNENRFTGKADVYVKYRPTYPLALMDYLYSEAGFGKESVIADVGSGTGKLTELLLVRGSKVFAVEPNEDMRESAESMLSRFENFISIKGTAENTTLKNSSCDFVTVAQAFHWFDRLKFKAECKRILKPRGKVGIIYNTKDSKSPLVMENEQICTKHCPNFKGFSGGMANASHEEFEDFFKDGICVCKTFENDTIYDEQGFVGRGLSASYAPRENEKNHSAYVFALKTLFQKYSTNGKITLPNTTTSFIGEITD